MTDQTNVAALDAIVRDSKGIEYGTVADMIEALDAWQDGALYKALGAAHGVLFNRAINPKYGPEFGPAASYYPEFEGRLIQDIVTEALAGISKSPSETPLTRTQ